MKKTALLGATVLFAAGAMGWALVACGNTSQPSNSSNGNQVSNVVETAKQEALDAKNTLDEGRAADYGITAADLAEIDALLAGGQLYGAPPAGNNWGGFQDKPRYSASPMEQSRKNGTLDKGDDGNKYLCPRCREGHLHLHKGKNGPFWGCSNYPRCTATFDDDKGAPLLN